MVKVVYEMVSKIRGIELWLKHHLDKDQHLRNINFPYIKCYKLVETSTSCLPRSKMKLTQVIHPRLEPSIRLKETMWLGT